MSTPEVRIGDRVRITRTNVYEGVVSGITDFGLDLDGGRYVRTCDESENVEILERAPKVFKVGDPVLTSELDLLVDGTILINEDESTQAPRFVDASRKMVILSSVEKFPFDFYSGSTSYRFTVAYVPQGGKK